MARKKYAPSAELVAGDLQIEIYPRGYVEWKGTFAQLVAEGLVAANHEKPDGFHSQLWNAKDGYQYWLGRCRPQGVKGPRRDLVEIDNWFLRRSITANRGTGFAEARLYQAQVALEREIFQLSTAGHLMHCRLVDAKQDRAFGRFMSQALS